VAVETKRRGDPDPPEKAKVHGGAVISEAQSAANTRLYRQLNKAEQEASL
jgi:hypothetical protein